MGIVAVLGLSLPAKGLSDNIKQRKKPAGWPVLNPA